MNKISTAVLLMLLPACVRLAASEPANVRRFISASWEKTVRYNTQDCPPRLGLPHPYTVPSISGAFQEMYYWDTFFTNEGLIIDGMTELAKGNVENMLHLVDRYGKMPNGSTTWFLNRSQPPFLSLMVRRIYEQTGDREWLSKVLPTLEREYSFWMKNRMSPCGLNRYGNEASDEEKMEFVSLLKSRFGDSFRTEGMSEEELLKTASHYIAEAESGWDFTPRFGGCCEYYCPVDLNSLLYAYETNFAWFRRELGQSGKAWDKAAARRRKLMRRLMCDKDSGMYYDYCHVSGKRSEVSSAAVFSLLFCGVADAAEAEKIAALTLEGASQDTRLEYEYGLSSCAQGNYRHVYQWSYPNGWAPLHYIAVHGLHKYGLDADAGRLAKKYVDMVAQNFDVTGNLWEKYNVVEGNINVSNEYEMPTMMGWTAGTFCSLCSFLGITF